MLNEIEPTRNEINPETSTELNQKTPESKTQEYYYLSPAEKDKLLSAIRGALFLANGLPIIKTLLNIVSKTNIREIAGASYKIFDEGKNLPKDALIDENDFGISARNLVVGTFPEKSGQMVKFNDNQKEFPSWRLIQVIKDLY